MIFFFFYLKINNSVSEFNEFKPRSKFQKNRFQLSASMNQLYLSPGLNFSRASNSLISVSGIRFLFCEFQTAEAWKKMDRIYLIEKGKQDCNSLNKGISWSNVNSLLNLGRGEKMKIWKGKVFKAANRWYHD